MLVMTALLESSMSTCISLSKCPILHNRLVFHFLHVLKSDYILISGRGNVNIGQSQGIFDGQDLEALHRSSQPQRISTSVTMTFAPCDFNA